MPSTSMEQRRRSEALEPAARAALQLSKLNDMLAAILPANKFYAEQLSGLRLPLSSLEELQEAPLTSKSQLVAEGGKHQGPANLTWPLDHYVHYHQTSGTHGRPLPVYDTAEDWTWWVNCWQYVLDAAEVTSSDRALLAFSFGPFIGFWSAHDALTARGALAIPGGGMNTLARIDLIERVGATVLLATPTYVLRMAEVAEQHNINLGHLPIEKIIVAGEPGGSVPSVRARIEAAWKARVTDHGGASEVGPWGYSDCQQRGLFVLESEFIAEFLSVDHGGPASPGELAQLVLTSLGRHGMPVIRYLTGDLVRPSWPDNEANRSVLLRGGVLGRTDDMMVIRGVNIFPSSVEQILRSFPEVVEYRMTARKEGAMDSLVVEVEDHLQNPQRISEELRLRLGLKVDVHLAPAMSLPRFEGKGRRFVDRRGD